jgi:hypothetical protein
MKDAWYQGFKQLVIPGTVYGSSTPLCSTSTGTHDYRWPVSDDHSGNPASRLIRIPSPQRRLRDCLFWL